MQSGRFAGAKASALRSRLSAGPALVAPGVYDALSARLVERAGFDAMLVSGAAVCASMLGIPDLGLMSSTEVLWQTRNIAAATRLPVIADCDTGYGNPLNVRRTVQDFEAAGVAGLFIEDQVAPKRCGHFDGKDVISAPEMVEKLRAAVDARQDPSLVLIARTDAIAVEGLEAALDRAARYVDAGADAIFIEAPRSLDDLRSIPKRIDAPVMLNLVEGGRTPLVPFGELGSLGYRLITLSGSIQKAAIKAIEEVLDLIAKHGDLTLLYPDRIVSLEDRSEILGLSHYRDLEQRYAPR